MQIYNELIKRKISFSKDIPSGPSFIMHDGLFLDMNKSKEIINGEKKDIPVFHVKFDAYLNENNIVDKLHFRTLLKTDNAIAINDTVVLKCESAYFDLPNQRPTEAQFVSLLNWLSNASIKNKCVVMRTKSGHETKMFDFKTLENDNGYLPEDIIKEAKKTYA